MPIVWRDESPFIQELKKWDTPKHLGGMNADGFEPFPKMLYRAQKLERSGQFAISDPIGEMSSDPTQSLRAVAFTNSCQMTVGNQHELDRALAQGWRAHPREALEYQEQLQRDVARAAAETNFAAQRMGEKARAELGQVNAETHEHVHDVPAPARRRGRKPKAPEVQ